MSGLCEVDINMTKLLTILIALLTCATLHAQSVVVYKTDAGNVRGKATEYVPGSIVTNLIVTGDDLDPDITGTYTPYSGGGLEPGTLAWSDWSTPAANWVYVNNLDWRLGDNAFFYYWTGPADENPPPGNYTADVGVTGTATVAYSIITNVTPATVIIHGIATP